MADSSGRRVRQTFLMLACGYVCINIIARWLRWPLFHGHGEYGWAQPGWLDYALLLAICVVPVVIAFVLVDVATARFIRSRRALAWLALGLLLWLLALEIDMSWYRVSKRHLGWSEIKVILFAQWTTQIGLSPQQLYHFAGVAAVHAAAFTLMYLCATCWPYRQPRTPRMLQIAVLLSVLAFVVQPVVMGRASMLGDQQMGEIVRAHPLRIAGLAALYRDLAGYSDRLRELNALYATIEPAAAVRPGNALATALTPLADTDLDIVVFILEGLNTHYFSDLVSLQALEGHAVQGLRHYSTGDATHYGLLGLSHGQPVLFYGGVNRPQSQPVQTLNAAGFVTRRFGKDVSQFGNIAEYTRNFSQPTIDPPGNWDLLDDLRDYLAPDTQRKLALVYYEGTHFPYVHRPEFTRYLPEVPTGFDYSGWDMQHHRQAVINRYRNVLAELDAWLEHFLAQTDLQRTVIVITGDHGEEMFEHGRMTHAGGLWEGQLRVPLLIHVPGIAPLQVGAITSHADVLPALLQAFGLAEPAQSDIVDGYAIAAHNNFVATPVEWVFIHGDDKVLFTLGANGRFVITGVSSRDDTPLSSFDASAGTPLRATLARMKSAENAGQALLRAR